MSAPLGADQAVIDSLKATMNETYDDLLTHAQAQDVLGISRSTLARLFREEKLDRVVHAGKSYVTSESMAAYIRRLNDDLLTYAQAQDVLGISRSTLSRMVRERRLDRVIHKGKYYVTNESMTTYIRTLRRPSAAPQPTDAVERRTA